MIFGEMPVNIAARLQQKAEPGQILLSKDTADLLSKDFTLVPQGETDLKGHTPVVTYILKAKTAR